MRIGLFGGTFDPVHFGHLLMAEQCREQCQLDLVQFIPAFSPPHKQDARISPVKDRVAMLELAIAGEKRLQVNRIEIERKGTSYTVETLREIHRQSPTDELFLLIGADSLHDLPTWREPHEILSLCRVVAVNRGRTPPPVESVIDALGESARNRVQIIEMPAVDLSATDIRQRVSEVRSIHYMTPRAVMMYIQSHKLFVPTPE